MRSRARQRLANITQQQDDTLAGGTFWTWKEQGGGGWSMWVGTEGEEGMHQQETRRKLLCRARPKVVAGQLTKLEYDADEQTMLMEAEAPADGGGDALVTVVYIPVDVTTDKVVADGAVEDFSVEAFPDGSRLVSVTVQAAGESYRVGIGRDLN